MIYVLELIQTLPTYPILLAVRTNNVICKETNTLNHIVGFSGLSFYVLEL